MATPEMQDFLRAVPQASRLLRPLCHILGIDPPPASAPSVRADAGEGKIDAHGDGETERRGKAGLLLSVL
jgi:hypothetical protein